jgi:hypothetical protein
MNTNVNLEAVRFSRGSWLGYEHFKDEEEKEDTQYGGER